MTKKSELSRRLFVQTVGALSFTAAEAFLSEPISAKDQDKEKDRTQIKATEKVFVKDSTDAGNGSKWYRGSLHMHTFRSDGTAFPEEAAALYKRLGFHFVALTDHNSTHEDPDRWLKIGQKRLTQKHIDRYKKEFSPALDHKKIDGKDAYRLKTFDEMEKILNESERFLLISGNEVSRGSKNGEELHCGFINTRTGCRPIETETAAENLQWSLALAEKLLGGTRNPETLFVVNHPLWRYYDIDPQLLIDHPEIRFFEVANVEARPLFPATDEFWTHDKFWDIVNTFRAEKGLPLLYGIGSDDTHNYDMFYNGVRFIGYVMVRAMKLSLAEIIGAMHQGDFYVSTGLELDRLELDRAAKTIRLKVHEMPGYRYKIEFIGTKKGFDPSIKKEFDHTASGEIPQWARNQNYKLPTRHIKVWSDEIGTVLKTVDGPEGSYQLQNDDLFVRARIVTQKGTQPEQEHPANPIAWTQPISHFSN